MASNGKMASAVNVAGDALASLSVSENGKSNDGTLLKWGFDLPQLYQLAVQFYKEKEGKVLHLSYPDRLRFAALVRQATHGPCRPETLPPLGVLDVIGRDRRQAWQELGDIDRAAAMLRYVELLDSVCPIFKPYAEAHKRHIEAKRKKREQEREEEELRQSRLLLEDMARKQRQTELRKQADTKRLIQDALNRQTYGQFRTYAAQQYPGDPEQQAVLVRQLQEQHYRQYMQQLYQKQQLSQQQQQIQREAPPLAAASRPCTSKAGVEDATKEAAQNGNQSDNQRSISTFTNEDTEGLAGGLAPARLWTRRDLDQFKAAIRAEGGQAVITIAQGETATVRVPTTPDGSCLFWEFASDGFDLGFGVRFVWGSAAERRVTVTLSDGDGDSDDAGESDGGQSSYCVVPVYRRDCHQQVYAGSHQFPGQGVYLLKFDNSYSLWRVKTLYYRVYYTQ